MPDFGAFVISLDFELHWGVRDICPPEGPYRENLLGSRAVIPRILDLFRSSGIAATWATVGFLFASSRSELEEFSPERRPRYENPALDPYRQQVGETEETDPLHFAPSIIREIQRTPRQEIGTHTFSHYYCVEPGQDKAAFKADMESAIRIADLFGVRPESIVFPRNQVNPAYRDVLLSKGILSYRGNQKAWIYRFSEKRDRRWIRAARLLDAYVPLTGKNLCRWDEVMEEDGLCNIPASAFLRPGVPGSRAVDALRLRRISECFKEAARSKRIFHLWWHPHNFGAVPEENLDFLRAIIEVYRHWQDQAGLRSMNMREVATMARREAGMCVACPTSQ
jgi:peptidoglycan/xylan/chitin deacetylase (PgdA/CDA1 family)